MFEGLMPAMVTPFDEGGELDFEATEAVVEHFREAGVSGISPLGSTGEATHLTSEERKRFAEEVVRIVGGRVPLVVGIGTSGTRETVELATRRKRVRTPLWSFRLPTGRLARRPCSGTSRPWPGRWTSRSLYTTSRCLPALTSHRHSWRGWPTSARTSSGSRTPLSPFQATTRQPELRFHALLSAGVQEVRLTHYPR
jgi:Dihydrodipicolinate synthetase family